jgi:hypothetical protein
MNNIKLKAQSHIKLKRVVGVIYGVLAFFLLLSMVLYFCYESDLRNHGVQTMGIVTDNFGSGKHSHFTLEYYVGGIRYTDTQDGSLIKGDTVVIFYKPEYPADFVIGYSTPVYFLIFGFLFFGGTGFFTCWKGFLSREDVVYYFTQRKAERKQGGNVI